MYIVHCNDLADENLMKSKIRDLIDENVNKDVELEGSIDL